MGLIPALPGDVLTAVFAFLDPTFVLLVVENVCKSWRLASQSGDCWPWLYPVLRAELHPYRFRNSSRVKSLAFCPDRHTLLCAGYDGSVFLYDYLADTVPSSLSLTDRPIRMALFNPSRPGEVVCGDDSGRVYVLQVADTLSCLRIVRVIRGRVRAMAFIYDTLDTPHPRPPRPGRVALQDAGAYTRHLLLVGGSDGCIRLLAPEADYRCVKEFGSGTQQDVMCLCASPTDPHQFACGTLQAQVQVWLLDERCLACPRRLKGHTRCVNSVQYSTVPDRLVSCSDDAVLIVWNLADTEGCPILHILQAHNAAVMALTVLPHLIVSGAEDGSLVVTSEATERRVYHCQLSGMGRIWDLTYRPAGLPLGDDLRTAPEAPPALLAAATDRGVVISSVSTHSIPGPQLRRAFARQLQLQASPAPRHPSRLPSPAISTIPYLLWGCWLEKCIAAVLCLSSGPAVFDHCPSALHLFVVVDLVLPGLLLAAFLGSLFLRPAWRRTAHARFAQLFIAGSMAEVLWGNVVPLRCGALEFLFAMNVGTALAMGGSLALYAFCPRRRPVVPRRLDALLCADCCDASDSDDDSAARRPIPWILGELHDGLLEPSPNDVEEPLLRSTV